MSVSFDVGQRDFGALFGFGDSSYLGLDVFATSRLAIAALLSCSGDGEPGLIGRIGSPRRRKLGMSGMGTDLRHSALGEASSCLNSISKRPSTFMPINLPSSDRFAPQKSSFRDSSTIGLFPVERRTSPNRCQF